MAHSSRPTHDHEIAELLIGQAEQLPDCLTTTCPSWTDPGDDNPDRKRLCERCALFVELVDSARELQARHTSTP